MSATLEEKKFCPTLNSLYLLREIAYYNMHKCRWDPFLMELHQQYYDAVSSIVEAYSGVHHAK